MSGLNPFRPRKPEHPTAHPHPSSHPASANLEPSFIPSVPIIRAPNPPVRPNGVPQQPPVSQDSDNGDSVASDEQSLSDPFHQESYTDDENGRDDEELQRPHKSSLDLSPAPPSDDHAQQPLHAASSETSFSTSGSGPTVGTYNHDIIPESDDKARSHDDSSLSIRSSRSYGGVRTADSSTVDLAETSSLRLSTGTARLATGHPSPTIGTDSKLLASRSGNRERIPPPPPKSHHGKLINSSLDSAPSQGSSSKATNRFSFHGSPSEPSFSPKPSNSTTDYFTGEAGSQPEKATESLQRSQSQYKRPPTPPLSRRHSQMRRSKTTLSKPTLHRLSMPAGTMEATESPPPSPSSWQITPSRTRDARLSTPSSEGNSLRPPPLTQSPGAVISTLGTDVSNPPSVPPTRASSAKRSSQINTLPPPPPPRRTRKSSSQSNDSVRPMSGRFDENQSFVPQPSNAHDILADLSRLQKEVDDLRGHYENRKPSH
ncbi:hypothetical protein FE257_002436 [Aspergillus nanangensis]|uniref:Uncharacterized protein n=1 Tax=Aspergillus nanangensis TaxID=2582783 RepID=A0AAD4GWU0_ASPNN|nr:hypothetical protein FE257_002436 [Aspergillus nanangensis]